MSSIKEKFFPEGKTLLSSFFSANAIDASITMIGIKAGAVETNLVFQSPNLENDINRYMIIKIAVTAMLLACYALTKSHQHKWNFTTEKVVQLTNIIVWSANVGNTIVTLDAISKMIN